MLFLIHLGGCLWSLCAYKKNLLDKWEYDFIARLAAGVDINAG